MFEENEYVLYSYRKELFIAMFNGYTPSGNLQITLIDGRKVTAREENVTKINYYRNKDDYLSVIDIALDTSDKEWFEELITKLKEG